MSAITPYLNQTITLVPRSGYDGDGQSTYGAGASVKARVERRSRLVRNESGEQVLADSRVFLEPDQTIAEGYRITFEGATYQVLSVTYEQGLSAVSHIVAWTGRVEG